MCNFFRSIANRVAITSDPSTNTHVNAQRSNAVAQIVGDGLQAFNPVLIIPTVFAQTLISLNSIFSANTLGKEKVIHTLQAGLAAAQLGLAITLLFNNTTCTTLTTPICLAVGLTQFLYKGTLLVGWVPAEFSQASAAAAPAAPGGGIAAAPANAALFQPARRVRRTRPDIAANQEELIPLEKTNPQAQHPQNPDQPQAGTGDIVLNM